MAYHAERMSDEFIKYHLNPNGEAPWPFHPVIHHFTAPDRGGPHDHPWGFTSHVLKGSYWERIYYVDAKAGRWTSEDVHRQAGTAHRINATHIHEIISLPEGECWTLILPGPWERVSGFWRFDAQGAAYRPWNAEEFKPVLPGS